MKKNKNKMFNFRISSSDVEKIRLAKKKLGYTSNAELIRTAIREKIKREVYNG